MFYIIESGARIHTPLGNLLRARNVQALSASAPVRAIDERDAAASSDVETVSQAYHESDQPTERHRVKFAHEIMSSPVVTGRVGQTLSDIWQIFADNRIHHLPLLDAGLQLQGIVSDRDIMRFAANSSRAQTNTPIGQLMTRSVITAAADTEVRDLAEVMVRRAIGAIPVINDSAGIEGIVSRTDILRTLVHRAPLELWT